MAKHKSYSRMRKSAVTWLGSVMQDESWYSKFTAPLAYKKGVELVLKQYPRLPVRDVKRCVGIVMQAIESYEQDKNTPSPPMQRAGRG